MFVPATLDLKALFHDPNMFDSPSNWRRAGFKVEGEGDPSNIMVASHPSMTGRLFKKYSRVVSLKEQHENYRRRVKGADKLRAFITAGRLSRLVVPQKQLHELPSEFSHADETAYVLIVELLDLLRPSDSKQRYRELDKEGLRQLCTALCAFEGLDSGVRNLPFTRGGQIAFVDTERWDKEKKIPLRHVSKYLSNDQLQFMKSIFWGAGTSERVRSRGRAYERIRGR
jgi:hypothetical protein